MTSPVTNGCLKVSNNLLSWTFQFIWLPVTRLILDFVTAFFLKKEICVNITCIWGCTIITKTCKAIENKYSIFYQQYTQYLISVRSKQNGKFFTSLFEYCFDDLQYSPPYESSIPNFIVVKVWHRRCHHPDI